MTVALRRSQAGTTLVEILLALTILALGVIALINGMFTSVVASNHNVKQATAEAVTRAYAEFVKRQPYANCSLGYGTNGMVFPERFTPTAAMRYFNPTTGTWQAVCPLPDSGLQKVIVTVASDDGLGSATLEVVKRREALS